MRKLFIVLLVLGGLALAVPVIDGCLDRNTAKKLMDLERFLSKPDPKAREWAAGELLDAYPSRSGELRLVRAQALVELGRLNQARAVLDGIPADQPKPTLRQAALIRFESYLVETTDVLARAKPDKAALAVARVEQLLTEAETARQSLEQMQADEVLLLKLRAREIEARARALRLEMVVPKQAHDKALAANVQDEIEKFGERVEDLRSKIRKLENRLVQLCNKAIELDGDDPEPRRILFSMWLAAGEFKQARRMAQQLCELPQVHAALAGRYADSLLSMEERFGVPVTEDDVEVARSLLDHAGLTDHDSIELGIARVTLALHDRDPALAEALATALLEKYPKHARAVSLLSIALCEQGRADQAVEVLDPIYEKNRSAVVRWAMGRALVEQGDERHGHELIRQSLDLQPNNLPARLFLAQTLVDGGHVLEAERDIRQATQMYPDHPQVLGLYARLLIERLDRAGVRRLMEQHVADPHAPVNWRDVAIACAMVLDDRAAVAVLCNQGSGLVGAFGRGWLDAPRVNRFETAAIVARTLLRAIDDPLAVGVGLVGGSDWTGMHPVEARTPDPLTRCIYVPWPTVPALELAEAGLRRWPEQPWLLEMSCRLWLWSGREGLAHQRLAKAESLGLDLSPTGRLARAYLDGTEPAELDRAGASESEDATAQWLRLAALLRAGQWEPVAPLLQHILGEHHWPEQALLKTIRTALAQERGELVEAYLTIADDLNPSMARLVRSRLHLARDKPVDAVYEARMLSRGEHSSSELRRLLIEVLTRANAAIGHVELAVGMFENLALAQHDDQLRLRLAAVDLLIDTDRYPTAALVVDSMIQEGAWSPRDLDRIMQRAVEVMRPDQFAERIEKMTTEGGQNPVVLFYDAVSRHRAGDTQQAEAVLRRVLEAHPNAGRVTLELAAVLESQGKTQEARDLISRLVEHGGLAARAATERLEQLGRVTEPAS